MLPEPQVLSIIAGMQEFVAKRQNSLTGKFEFKKKQPLNLKTAVEDSKWVR
jgi:hypothetical protein